MDLSRLLRDCLEVELPNLLALTDDRAALPRGPGKWSPKEELGHLIDSASNNHQRFVRAALDSEYRGPSYAQDDWVRIHGYRDQPWDSLVSFWRQYNLLLAEVIERVPAPRLENPCYLAGYSPVPLASLIQDYVLHMQHHIDLLLLRPHVTPYPTEHTPRLSIAALP